MLEAGVDVGLGTDSVASNNRCDMIEEARFCGLIHRATSRDSSELTPERLLKLATLDGARTLRLDREIGSLEVGKQADIVAIDLSGAHNTPIHDPVSAIIFSASADDVIFTAVAGRVLFDGALQTLDESDLQQRVDEAMSRVLAKLS